MPIESETAVSSATPPAVVWTGESLRLLDQRELPHAVAYLELSSPEAVADAIRDMVVRGAPAIGCAAAFGVALAARNSRGLNREAFDVALKEAAGQLRSTRPTAVNLFGGVDAVLSACERAASVAEAVIVADRAARGILAFDRAGNIRIGELGAALLPTSCAVLTHCNAGALATSGYGTALGVVRAAHACGKLRHVYADETRPRLQGLQLTAWELMCDGIPVTVIPDGAAASLMRAQRVHAVVVGADRIASNGDAANKIGTYGVAVLARHHGIPFYVAAPTSTMDWSLASGDLIPIEERASTEVTHIGGLAVAPTGVDVWNPAFDVTPSELITAIITERGVVHEPSVAGMQSLQVGGEEDA